MDNVIAFVFYLVLFLNAYLLFVMVTGRRGKPIEVALFAVISMTLSFWLDNYFIVLDPFYVLFFSYFTKKKPANELSYFLRFLCLHNGRLVLSNNSFYHFAYTIECFC